MIIFGIATKNNQIPDRTNNKNPNQPKQTKQNRKNKSNQI